MSKEPKNCRIIFRVTETEKKAFQAKVATANTTESGLLRERILNDEYYIVAREPKASVDKKKLTMLYNKSSNNLNQLAHQANSHNLKGTLNDKLFEQILVSLKATQKELKKGVDFVD